MTQDDIIQARMERPFTRIGLANTLREHDPYMSHVTAKMIADIAIDKAVKAKQIEFTKAGGVGVYRRIA